MKVPCIAYDESDIQPCLQSPQPSGNGRRRGTQSLACSRYTAGINQMHEKSDIRQIVQSHVSVPEAGRSRIVLIG